MELLKSVAQQPKVTSLSAMKAVYNLRLFYFLTGLTGGLLGPYLTTLFSYNGLSSNQVGIVMSIGTCISVLIQPIWGMLVDRYQCTRLILTLSLAVPGILAYFYNTGLFMMMVIIYSVSTIFAASQIPTSDSYAVEAAKQAKKTYGSIRSLGSFGNALGGFAGGLYLSYFLIDSIWVPYLILNVAAITVVLILPFNRSRKSVSGNSPFSKGVKELITNPIFIVFLLGCFMVNQTLTAFNTYFVLSFQAIGGSFSLAGTALLIASLTNVPAMVLASRVINRIGYEKTLLFAATAYIVRWGIQLFFPIPFVVIGIQVLHGLSFGFFYIAAVEYVAKITGKHIQATGQSVFNMVFVGLAGMVGNLLNGYLFEVGGPNLMYLSCSISSCFGAILLFYVYKITKQRLNPA
ncbi:MFS transporter [Robertmurraya beringensis]|uniref:MFS transporter n=1 Tax=Robertmurraya beringensis TaxID=641660 RepID=A0ABV6KR04_9BACI